MSLSYDVSEEVARDDELLEAAREAARTASSPRARAAAELLVETMEKARAKYLGQCTNCHHAPAAVGSLCLSCEAG